jgi:fatty-acyl-CoA synthase
VSFGGGRSEKYIEEVAACVQLRSGSVMEAAEIQDYCRGRSARYKIPQYVFFVDSFPMTANGKMQKFKLREQAASLLKNQLPVL